MEPTNALTLRGDSANGLDPAKLEALQQNMAIRYFDPNRGKNFLINCGYDTTTPLYEEYNEYCKNKKNQTNKKRTHIISEFILGTFRLLKLKRVDVFYIEEGTSNLYRRCSSVEDLKGSISLYYQILFGAEEGIDDAFKSIVSLILPRDKYSEIDRNYIQICDNYYWNRKTAEIVVTGQEKDLRYDVMPSTVRCFAKMFDTDMGDKNIFKVPKFDDEDIETMLSVYEELKDVDYYEWPDEYHFQCFKDWSKDRLGFSYGMMAIPALPFMRVLPRGAIFNDGDGHNGKSVLNGLAISILGKNNVSMIKGDELGDWDHLVNFQTTWMNIPNETTVDFLQNNTEAFKTMSAQETLTVKKKHGDESVDINCDFPMVFNINKLPKFSEDASAVLSRMFVVKWDVDFEAEGRVIKEYHKKVFLADKAMMPKIVGAVLAYAHYYSQEEHLWEPSEEMKEAKGILSEVAVPRKEYYKWFSMFMSSFSGIKLVKTDFLKFGSEEGDDYDGSDINMKQRPFSNNKRVCDGNSTYYKVEGPEIGVFNKFKFTPDLRIRKYMGSLTLEQYHDGGHSLIHAMREDYLVKMANYENDLKTAGMSRTGEDKNKHVMQQIYYEISKEGFTE